MKVVGLFSGIGGLETPFHRRGASTAFLCDAWEASQAVLAARFRGVRVHGDIAEVDSLPAGTDLVTAGFPCTDLSQAGRTAGIGGKESGLVAHVFRLLRGRKVEWLVLENVRNMLVLDKGKAMAYLVAELEALGYRWAYRLVDSRFCGTPQRRHRVLLVASRSHDPREVLFADEHGDPGNAPLRDDAFGFYWTEGLKGLGWARDGVPPLKGGSTVGIPSPPAIWIPGAPLGRRLVTPTIEDAEALQGFPRGWTEPACAGTRNGPRWKLVGNAVSVGVSDWLAGRIAKPGPVVVPSSPGNGLARWPDAAFGERGRIEQFHASHWPVFDGYTHLLDVVDASKAPALSARAAAGFLDRARRASLRFDPGFLRDVEEHAKALARGERRGQLPLFASQQAVG